MDIPDESEELDPRIEIELENLNSSTDVINKLEHDLDDARSAFRQLLTDSSREINSLSRKLGSCVEKARPYYEARMNARHAMLEAQTAACRFEKASSAHEAAKEMVALAEEGYKEKGMEFDQAWQEMLNHASRKVNDAEVERNESAEEHRIKSAAFQRAERRVHDLQKSLKRSINKSRKYFDMKAMFHQKLDDQKRRVQLIEETILMTKIGYSESLRELERISEEIHRKRDLEKNKCRNLGERGSGVGAEDDKIFDERSNSDVLDLVKRKLKPNLSITEDKNLNLQVQCEVSQELLPSNEDCSNIKSCLLTNSHFEPSVNESSQLSSESSSLATSPVYEPLTQAPFRAKPILSPLQNLKLKDEEEYSDSESIQSVEMMDDCQIDRLLLETTLKDSIDRVLSPSVEQKPIVQK